MSLANLGKWQLLTLSLLLINLFVTSILLYGLVKTNQFADSHFDISFRESEVVNQQLDQHSREIDIIHRHLALLDPTSANIK